MSDTIKKLKELTKCSFSIHFNDHRTCYTSTEDEIKSLREGGYDYDDLTLEEEKECIANNELWFLVWYSKTPVGSYSLYAPTFEKLLLKIEELIEEIKND